MRTEFEEELHAQGFDHVLGLDEAGRGPLAGPLVVAGVCFPKGYTFDGINDSKQLSTKKREELFDIILKDALYYAVEVVDVEIIDQLNIYRATQVTMEKIVNDYALCHAVLSDAMPLPTIKLPTQAIVKGDAKSISIAAASILAKVTRDKIMQEYALQYPEYGFEKHKGYPTKQHLEALETYGVLPIHRKSYGPVARQLQTKLDI